MCHGQLDITNFEARHGLDFADYFRADLGRLSALERDGLIDIGPHRLVVRPRGRFLLRVIAMCFDAHLNRPGSEEVRYSRAV
jgi:oxygen-independent coproporphyrinogen-3 oxidase